MTSSGYYLGKLDISDIGGNNKDGLHALTATSKVKSKICDYQKIQGSIRDAAMVAGGTNYKNSKKYDIKGDWKEVIDYVKSQVDNNTSYNEDILTRIERSNTSGNADDSDELLPDAIELVARSGQASVSMLQRRFRIGYNRAARIIDMMESRGIIGPQDGSRPRQVLMTEEEFERFETEGEQ